MGAVPSLISSVILLACCFTRSLLASVFFSCCRCFTARFSLSILRLEWFVFNLSAADHDQIREHGPPHPRRPSPLADGEPTYPEMHPCRPLVLIGRQGADLSTPACPTSGRRGADLPETQPRRPYLLGRGGANLTAAAAL